MNYYISTFCLGLLILSWNQIIKAEKEISSLIDRLFALIENAVDNTKEKWNKL